MAQTLADIKRLLAAHGLHPKHKHGQNFLHDASHMAKIVAAAGCGAGDLVLEVGPGTGALTERLLETGAEVLAVEIDTDLAPILRDRCGPAGERFRLILSDVLDGKHHIHPQVVAALGDRPFRLIANLPYHVASPLLANLALDHPRMQTAVVMVQKEVADRLCAKSGGKEYGPLGIVIQAFFTAKRIDVLPPGCFHPPPSIASAVAQLVRRPQPLCADGPRFAALVHRLFQQRRKQVGTILGRSTPLPPDVDPMARPETLSVETLCGLDRHLAALPAA